MKEAENGEKLTPKEAKSKKAHGKSRLTSNILTSGEVNNVPKVKDTTSNEDGVQCQNDSKQSKGMAQGAGPQNPTDLMPYLQRNSTSEVEIDKSKENDEMCCH